MADQRPDPEKPETFTQKWGCLMAAGAAAAALTISCVVADQRRKNEPPPPMQMSADQFFHSLPH